MMNQPDIGRRVTRCAIYTRKSTEYRLDLPVNSLETQRDVCRSYIRCQAHRNWVESPTMYDDGGYSGGTLVRPALARLITDIEHGRVDMIVIYKIDRLTRSLLDFVRLIEVLDKYGVGFVSVTQAFDTSDSMGRLVLNILLTFAQFERELMSDRVRDKKAAMRKNGLFAGGLPPFGYIVERGGRLVVDEDRALIVKELFERYPKAGGVYLYLRCWKASCSLFAAACRIAGAGAARCARFPPYRFNFEPFP
jgi:site-specific DNA recombinase